MTKTADQIVETAKQIAADLGLPVKVYGVWTDYISEKLGPEVRVCVQCEDKKQTWGALRKVARGLAAAGAGKVWLDKSSHYEVRVGVFGSCSGWANGSRAEMRVFPEAE